MRHSDTRLQRDGYRNDEIGKNFPTKGYKNSLLVGLQNIHFVAFCGREFVTLPIAFLYFLEHSRI